MTVSVALALFASTITVFVNFVKNMCSFESWLEVAYNCVQRSSFVLEVFKFRFSIPAILVNESDFQNIGIGKDFSQDSVG